MKKALLIFFIIIGNYIYSQLVIPSDLKFDTNVALAENNWVVLPVKQTDKNFLYGFVYYDEVAGYTLEVGKFFNVVDNKFVVQDDKKENNRGSMKLRLQNLGFKVAFLNDSRLKELSLQKTPDWLKSYNSNLSENEKKVNRASFLNGLGNCDIALSFLEKVKSTNFKSNKFYFEMAFAYNALNKFAEAENVFLEAKNNGFLDELILKEYHYSLLHLGKLEEASNLLKNNVKVFKNKSYLSESILNQMNFYYKANKNDEVKKWINFYRKEVGEDNYKTYIDKFEDDLKQK